MEQKHNCASSSCLCGHSSQNSGDWKGRYDELLKTFNIENRKPTDYEVSVESAVKQFLRTEIDRAERRVREKLLGSEPWISIEGALHDLQASQEDIPTTLTRIKSYVLNLL